MHERDDEPTGPPRCRKCGARMRYAPDCYDYDRSTGSYVLASGATEEHERDSGHTCGRCGQWHEPGSVGR